LKNIYFSPKLAVQRLHVFQSPQTEPLEGGLTTVDNLRPLYLLNGQHDVLPAATRITLALDGRLCDWQKVVQCTLPVWDKPVLGEGWYFLCHVAHSCVFAMELGVLCSDGKTRIAVVDQIEIPPEANLGLFLLPRRKA
jgi:hypothetical protein